MDVEAKLTKSLDELIKDSGASGRKGGRGRGGGRSLGTTGSSGPARGRGRGGRGSGRQQRDTDGDYGGRSGRVGGQKRARNDDTQAYVQIRVARRIYVNNLSWKTTWEDLKYYFRAAGNVVYAEVLREGKESGARSKGCGIVEFERPEEAAYAISHLHLTQLDGREINVREDREDEELLEETGRAPGGGGGKRGRSGDGFAPGTPACYTCGQPGHIARECPASEAGTGMSEGGKGTGGGACYECGQPGHIARECPNTKSSRFGGSGACFECGQPGHIARECPNTKSSRFGGSGACYECGQPGHIARDCPKSGGGKAGGGACYECGQPGHIARECPNK